MPGSKHPPYSMLTVAESYKKFCTECAGKDYVDPRGLSVSIMEANFVKLLGTKRIDHITGEYLRDQNGRELCGKAKHILPGLKKGIFDQNSYAVEDDRIQTLFWIQDVIEHPDSIHKNIHPIIEGEEVYVKRYDKMGPPIKLVFVMKTYAGVIVVSTSFLAEVHRLCKFVTNLPIWPEAK